MARIIYPINGKTYTAEDVEIFNSPRTSGIYSVLDFDCSLSGNVLTIGKGLAWIKNGDFTGKCVAFTEPETLTLDSADSTKNRFDVVAIRYDASKTEPELVIIKGEPADIPFPPERKKETYLYELFLYAILRKAGEGSASFENLSDLRDDETFCGIMRDSVTSSVAPLYETLYDDETGMSLFDGQPIPVETDKYVSYVATVKGSDMIVEIPLYAFDDTSFAKKLNGKRVISTSAGDETTFLITFECFSENISISDIFWSNNTGNGQAILTKLVGITKQPEGYVKVDDVYNPESHNAQSGEAVRQAIEEALAGFTGGGALNSVDKALLIEILKEGAYNSDVSGKIADFENAAGDSGDGTTYNYETSDNKTRTISSKSTHDEYPTALATYNAVQAVATYCKVPSVRWCAMGDSITVGYISEIENGSVVTNIRPADGWAAKLAAARKWELTNAGIGGTGWLTHHDGETDAAWNVADGINFNQFDVVTLAYGINDWGSNQPLGTIDDAYQTPTTICGAMRKTIETIIYSNPLCKIYVITPLNRAGQYMLDGDGNPVYLQEGTNWALGHKKNRAGTLEEVFGAIKNVCDYYGVEMIDMTHSSIVNRKNISVCLPDNIHPSEETHAIMARELSAKINFI